ncbi:MAG TPA: pilin [Candidatus Gracilibacteria bacterium]|nr:pilin [Candidatus Gracilibacteria bacterium]
MKAKIASLIFLLISIAPMVANAQVTMQEDLRPGYAVNITGGSGRASVANIILQMIAGSLIYAAGPIAVLMIAFGGFRYVTSHGDQNQMEEAKKTITWAAIGLVVIILSWAIVTNVITILSTTGTVGDDAYDPELGF